MTIDRASLLRAIGARKLADWVITERRSERLGVAAGAAAPAPAPGAPGGAGSAGSGAPDSDAVWRSERSEHLRVLVRRDLPSGRGTGVVEVQERSGDAAAVLAQAVALAEAAVEPAWTTPPPAAPARVPLLDELAAGALEPAAEALRGALHQAAARAGLQLVRWRGQVSREELTLGSAQGFEVAWQQSEYRITATVQRNGELATLRRTARRIAELELAGALEELAGELALPPGQPGQPDQYEPPPQPVLLQLGAEAMLGDDERGVWAVFAELAAAAAERRGAPGAERPRLQRTSLGAGGLFAQPPLVVWSDGALPFGTRSAPVGDEGEAVRRFRLFADGELGEPGLGPREAAWRGGAPNGGVRNLVINAGAAAAGDAAGPAGPGGPGGVGGRPGAGAAAPAALPLLEVRRLRWLRIDPTSGHAEAELALAIDRQRGTALRGGVFSLDLLRALATGQRAATLIRRGGYHGPAWIRLGPVQLR